MHSEGHSKIQKGYQIVESLPDRIKIVSEYETYISKKSAKLLMETKSAFFEVIKYLRTEKNKLLLILENAHKLNEGMIKIEAKANISIAIYVPTHKSSSQQNTRVERVIAQNIKDANEFEETLNKEILACTLKVNNLCMKALKIFRDKKKNYYSKLLEYNGTISTISRYQLSREAWKEFHQLDFIQDLKNCRKIFSSKFEEVKKIFGKETFLIEAHNRSVSSIAITSDNQYIISGSHDSKVKKWNLERKEQEMIMEEHKSRVNCIAITSDDSYIVSGSDDKSLRLWGPGHTSPEAANLTDHEDWVTAIAITSDNLYIISASRDKNMIVWNIREKGQEGVLRGHGGWVTGIAITSDNMHIVSASRDNTVRIWNLQQRIQEAKLEGHEKYITSVILTSDNNYIASGSGDNTVRLWNFRRQKSEHVFKGHKKPVCVLVGTQDSRYVVSGSWDNTIILWDLQARRIVNVLQGHTDYISCIAITNDQQYIVSGSDDRTIRIWNLQKRQVEAVLSGHSDWVTGIAITSDNKYIVSCSHDKHLGIWNLQGISRYIS